MLTQSIALMLQDRLSFDHYPLLTAIINFTNSILMNDSFKVIRLIGITISSFPERYSEIANLYSRYSNIHSATAPIQGQIVALPPRQLQQLFGGLEKALGMLHRASSESIRTDLDWDSNQSTVVGKRLHHRPFPHLLLVFSLEIKLG